MRLRLGRLSAAPGQILRRGVPQWRPLQLFFAIGAALLAPAMILFVRGWLLVDHCLETTGALRAFGVQMALLRPSQNCPDGAMALGGDAHQVLTLAVGVTVPLLIAHALLLGVGTAAAALAARLTVGITAVVDTFARVVSRALQALFGATAAPLLPVPRSQVVPGARPIIAAVRYVTSAWQLRAPPLGAWA